MKKIIITVALLASFVQLSFSQAYFSLYQLREIVPQTQSLQPAFIPENTFTFGLPTAGALTQGDFQLQDLISKPDGSVNYGINFDVLLAASADINDFNTDISANLFYVGLKTKKGAFSVFANARATIDLRYGRDLLEFLANGNSNRIGAELDFSQTRILMNSYHEIGIGHAREFLEGRLTVGARAKVITGMFHGSTQEGASAKLLTNQDDYSFRVTLENATVNTAGLHLFSDDSADIGSYALSNQNKGLAFDLGAKFEVFNWLTVEASMNDIGSINFKDEVRNYNSADAVATLSGVNLRGLEDLSEAVKDSLSGKFNSNETRNAFTARLPTRTYLSASLYLTPRNKFTIMAFNNHVFDEIDPSFAVAYNHTVDKFIFGVLGSYRGPQNELNFGANIASNIGPVQLYIAADNALVTNRPERYSKVDFRFGLNLMFGYKKWSNDTDVVDLGAL